MNYKTHIVGGVLAGTLILSKVEPIVLPIGIAFAGLGALIPDLDHQGSYLGRRMKITSRVLSTLGHRGLTHSPIILSIVFALLYALLNSIPFSKEIFLGLYIGSLSHIFLDMFNSMGVPLFSPIFGRYVSFGRIKVNSMSETVIRVGLIVVTVIAIMSKVI